MVLGRMARGLPTSPESRCAGARSNLNVARRRGEPGARALGTGADPYREVALRSVRISAKADRATYDRAANVILLQGNPATVDIKRPEDPTPIHLSSSLLEIDRNARKVIFPKGGHFEGSTAEEKPASDK